MLGISLIHPAVMTYIIHFRPSQEVRGCIHEIYYICNYAFFLALPYWVGALLNIPKPPPRSNGQSSREAC